jgi:hypothetical protein
LPEEYADILSFLLWQVRVSEFQPKQKFVDGRGG